MASSPEFAAHCVELLSPLGPTRAHRMFGGQGFYVDGIFMALALAERLYLKTDELTRARFEAEGCEPFVYEAKDEKRVAISYWSAPDEAMESPHLMLPWARLAMEAALRTRNAKAPKKGVKSDATKGAKKAPAKTAPRAAKPAPASAKPKRAASKPTR